MHFEREPSYEISFGRDFTNIQGSIQDLLVLEGDIIGLENEWRVTFINARKVRHFGATSKICILLSNCGQLDVSGRHS